jgi:hypothetical protein
MIQRNVAIAADFVVGDELTVYEWCMIYTDRNPAVAAKHATAEAQRVRMQYLGAKAPPASGPMPATVAGQDYEVDTREHYRITNAVYQELATAIQTGSLEPKRRAYLEDRPDELDPTLCVLDAAPILEIAERRGDGGQVIRKLLAAREPVAPLPQRRGAYKGALNEWMAQRPIDRLRRMTLGAIADEFKLHCERERPKLLRLLPKRLRSMERTIERIIERRVKAAKAPATTPRATRRQ